jgi:outer membrane receptor protein involved in Fe transport
MLRRSAQIIVVTSCFVLVAGAAHAERDLLDLSLEELVNVPITSTSYFDETLLSSASSVTWLDASRWNERGVRSVGELLNTMPSMLAPAAIGETRAVAIRGYINGTTGVSLRLDGVPMTRLRSGAGLTDLDGYDLGLLQSVEMIRGPGSAVHGADAFNGVLSLQTLAPSEAGSSLQLHAGSEQYSASSASGHFVHDQHALTTALAYRNIGDQQLVYPYTDPDTAAHAHGERSNALENTNVLLKYSNDLGQGTRAYVSTYLLKLDADELPASGRVFGGKSLAKDKDWSFLNSETDLVKLGAEHQFNSNDSLDVSAWYWANSIEYETLATPQQFANDEWRDENHWGVQLTQRHHFSDSAQVAVGYEHAQAVLYDHFHTVVNSAGVVLANHEREPDSGYQRIQNSLLVDGRFGVGLPATDLVYGGRYDRYNDFDAQFSPRLGLIHFPTENSAVKLLYGHAYRPPTLLEIFGSTQAAPNDDLQPEEIDSLELVYQHRHEHWFNTLTIFKNNWRKSIRGARLDPPQGNFYFQFRNSGEHEAKGIEWESQARWERTRLNLAVTWARGKDLDTGAEFSAFPQWMLDLGLGYRFSDPWDIYVTNRAFVRDAASRPVPSSAPEEPADDYLRTDIILSWRPTPNLTTRATVRNLFDRTNYLPSYVYSEAGIPDSGAGFVASLEWRH